MVLHNKYDKAELIRRLENENFKRITLSFYKYVRIQNPQLLRDYLYQHWDEMGVLGRIYIAAEGINAQLSVPEHNFQHFREFIDQDFRFQNVPFKIAVEDDGKSFHKLIVRLRAKIVADGLDDESFDVTNVGNHLTASEFNEAMNIPGTIVVDMRNHYESEIGRFENAICPDADTFKDELPLVIDMLKDKKDSKILMYCTGGVRCEKASAYLKHHGFQDVNQLYGGIIDYARQIEQQGLENKFKGKNFVFDNRMGERIGQEIISHCHQCGNPCDMHTNCANDACHLLFIQCDACRQKMNACCSEECKEVASLPLEKQRLLRKTTFKTEQKLIFKSRLRPRLAQYHDCSL